MLDYIIEEPEPECTHARGHRYPFIVSDILCSDNSALLDTFFADEEEEVEAEAEGDAEGDEEDSKDKDGIEIQASSNTQEDETSETKNEKMEAVETSTETFVQSEDKKVQSVNEHAEETKQHENDKQETESPGNNESDEKVEDSSENKQSDDKIDEEQKTESKEEDDKQLDSQTEIQNETNTQTAKEDSADSQSLPQSDDKANESKQKEDEEVSKVEDQKEQTKEDKSEETASESKVQENEQDQQDSESKLENLSKDKEEVKSEETSEAEKETESSSSMSEVIAEDAPIKNSSNLKLNQGEKLQENHVFNEEKEQTNHEEKENKPVGDKKIDSSSNDTKQALLKEANTEEKVEPIVMENDQEAKQSEVANDQEAAEEDKEYEIDETPIEDALPEEVSDDAKSLEQSADESTHVESEADPALKKHIIDILFDFVRKDDELNPVLCGYFSKFLYSLMGHNRKGFFTYVFNPENRVIEYLIKHIYNRSISELLIKILSENLESEEVKKEFIFNLLHALEIQDFEGKINGSMVLSELIDTKTFKDLFKSEEVNKRLFELLRSEDDLTVRSTLTVMNSLYKRFPFYTPKKTNEEEQDNFSKLYLPSNAQNTDDMDILPHIDNLLKDELTYIEQIIDVNPRDKLEQQYGQTITPFGATRLQAVKFITNIISLGNTDYAISLAACLPTLLKLCVDYPWNSMLHNYVETIFNELFKKNSKYKDEIRTAVIAETGLADYISSIQVQLEMPESGRSIRNGVIATFVNIANMLNNHESEYVIEELQKSDKWNEFVCTELFSANENNEKALAGHQSKACDSDEESANYETSMDKLFAVFTNLKESHDSSRDLDDSDEDEHVDTENVLQDLDICGENSDDREEKVNEEPAQIDLSPLPEQEEKVEETKVEEEKEHKETEDIENTKPEVSNRVEEEQIEENNTFYDNSYWQIPSGYNLDELIDDTSF